MERPLYAVCPRCGSRFNVMDAVDISRHAETVTYYAECECGAAKLTMTCGRITGIIPCEPLDIPDYYDKPTGSQEDPEYMAL